MGKQVNYDSTDDTMDHILKVQRFLAQVIENFQKRAVLHDQSKLQEPEKSAYDVLTPKLKGIAYGSDEYRAILREMKPAIDHHYAHNSHHPEFHSNGIDGMSLLDLIEMVCDWKAASERHTDGDIQKSLGINKGRFNISDQLFAILVNTIAELKW